MSTAATPEPPRLEQMIEGFEKVAESAERTMLDAGLPQRDIDLMISETVRALSEDFQLDMRDDAVVEILIRGFAAFSVLTSTASEQGANDNFAAMLYVGGLLQARRDLEKLL
jgi:hypothetical protein